MARHLPVVAPYLVLLLIFELGQLPWHRGGAIVDAKMEARFEKCCNLGTSWASEGLRCEKFTGPVTGVPRVEQGLCLETVDICCVKSYHKQQCEKGKADARNGLPCVTSSSAKFRGPGDYHRDCCEGCKLGILAGSMNQGCALKTFSFGMPWDPAFLQCCYELLPNTTTTDFTDSTIFTDSTEYTDSSSASTETESNESPSPTSTTSLSSQSTQSSSFLPFSSSLASRSTSIPTPALDDICELMKGLLCSDICVPTPGSYYCACREGFTLLEDGKTCRQVSSSDSCNPGFELAEDKRSCVPKSPENNLMENDEPDEDDQSPLCPLGYRYNSTAQICSDVDECIEKNVCPGRCKNTIGSFLCTPAPVKNYEACPPGYNWDSRFGSCADIDECALLPSVCPETTHFCVNTPGNFTCLEMTSGKSCPAGFKFDKPSRTCRDVDECAEGIHSCIKETEECRNIDGAYECDMKCQKGFRYSISSGTCVDVDECTESRRPCPQLGTKCVNTIGGYECARSTDLPLPDFQGFKIDKRRISSACSAGYKPANDTIGSCVDVDECSEHLHSCGLDEECVNEIGSYRCEKSRRNISVSAEENRSRGNTAYSKAYANYNQTTIPTVINELDDQSCEHGYTYDPRSSRCIDVDECATGTAGCSIGERCVNSIGDYKCHPNCLPGFELRTNPRNAQEDCSDVDECTRGLHNCNPMTHRCVNTNGTFVCEPLTGTNDTTPTTSTTTTMSTTRITAPTTGADPYWCGYGYTRDERTGQCIDVDECQVGPGCRDHERCHNIPGGYRCSPLCETGWYFSTTTRGCQDVDECLLGRHDCPQGTHQCVNTNGSFACSPIPPCDRGFRRIFNGSCIDIDECSENLHNCQVQLHQYCANERGSFKCLTRLPVCPAGYEYVLQLRRCEDIDECSNEQHSCDDRLSERCVNLPGTYRCERPTFEQRQQQRPACPSGYRYHPQLKKCTDIDECAEKLDSCGDEICYNQPGGYSCSRPPSPITRQPPTTPMLPSANQKCIDGTRFVRNRGCVDINECRENEVACSSNEQCVNTMGSYICNCRTGFKRENLTQACVDINECQMKNRCLSTQRCINTIGSFICSRLVSCGTGYTLNAVTDICEDDNECELGTHDCIEGYRCRNTLGSFRCDRNTRVQTSQTPAYTYSDTTWSEVTSSMSPPTTTMSTTTISRTSSLAPVTINSRFDPNQTDCSFGFEPGSSGKCVDIDECQQNPSICGRMHCVNTMGSYRCIHRPLCINGYTLDPVNQERCVDIDECADGSHDCTNRQTCENKQGGYICVCPPGHANGPNNDCIDIDECSIYGSNICGVNSRCENTVGSYRCICNNGFENIGGSASGICQDVDECQRTPGLCQHTCLNIWGSYRCGCNLGFRMNSDNRSCSDINECEEFKDNNLCIGICENTPGSYACKCPDGYRLGTDGRTCQDIDECVSGRVCRELDEMCQNTRGGFRCNKINCPAGYHRDNEKGNRCLRSSRFCQSGDHACFRMPSHYSYNFITFVSMFPLPPSGQLELFTMRGTHPLGSTVQFSMAFIEARAPPGVTRATESCFAFRRVGLSQVVLVMTKSIQGPQDIELNLSMEIYHNGFFAGSAVAKLFIYVSQYEF